MTPQEQRRKMAVSVPTKGKIDRIAGTIDRLVDRIARHWLAIFNTIVALFVLVPFMAPVLTRMGSTGACEPCRTAGRVIYILYSPTCHQLPERSYFLFGPQHTYTVSELEAAGVIPAGLNILQRELLRAVGAPAIGYKVALCERDIAIFGSLLLGGLIFGAARSMLRRRGREVPRLPVLAYLAALVPMILDGGTQLFGLRESNWILRSITGALFGLASVWLAYPYIQSAMADTVAVSQQKKGGGAQQDPQTGQNSSTVL
jgi:uncharacterized membrane protein